MRRNAPSQRVRLIRSPGRAVYDRETIDAILDEAVVAHLGFVQDGQPYVMPTLHARAGDVVYVHGSSASRMLRTLAGGVPACLTVTMVDGIVLSRSVYEHDINYRSVVVLGRLTEVRGEDSKNAALEAFMERLVPARWAEARPPDQQELKATSILRLPIEEASAKVRAGHPDDAGSPDGLLDVWAGHIPVTLQYGDPVPDPALRNGIPVSQAAVALVRSRQPGAAAIRRRRRRRSKKGRWQSDEQRRDSRRGV
jgi:uncharacterized protein